MSAVPSAAYMARVSTLRHYVHGDAIEDQPGAFYCRACDALRDADHFERPVCSPAWPHGHRELHRLEERDFYASLMAGQWIAGTYRPANASNCITGEVRP